MDRFRELVVIGKDVMYNTLRALVGIGKDAFYNHELRMYKRQLKTGSKLCRERIIPMNQKVIRRVKLIYDDGMECLRPNDNNPLIIASRQGLVDMVWGFIECAKQTNTNLYNGNSGEFQEFLWLRNGLDETALDVAIKEGHVEVAKLLLENASFKCLLSERNHEGKLPVSMLADQHDMFIWSILENAPTTSVDLSASTLISIGEQGSNVYTDSIMDPKSYPQSHKHELRDSLEKLDQGTLELTPNKNTILHLVSQNGDINYASEILVKHPSLVYRCNSEGEMPAYVAAREGQVDILEIIISHLRTRNDNIESLLVRSIDKHTALHIAIQNRHVGVAFWLMKEIPQLVNLINDFNESPIYLAVERGYYHLLGQILERHNTISLEGPNGKTVLHGAAISGSKECIEHLLGAMIDPQIRDAHGWTPLRYAVHHHNNAKAAAELVKQHPSIIDEIMIENDINTSAIHIAASRGYCEVLEALISECPGCTELVDEKGKNIFHVAVENKKMEVIELICQNASYISLLNKKDKYGNTPIRLLMASDLEMMDFSNNEKQTPLDMASPDDIKRRLLEGIAMGRKVNDNEKEKRAKANSKLLESFLVVATLIATASFAAAFTVPGGFNGNEGSEQGMPILLRKASFKAFMVTNTIAFSCSVTVLLMRVTIFFRDNGGKDNYDPSVWELTVMYEFIVIAMYSMMVAFATGIYVVLTPYHGFAIFLCTLTILLPFHGIAPVTIFNRTNLRKQH